jgi:hypothetical protein
MLSQDGARPAWRYVWFFPSRCLPWDSCVVLGITLPDLSTAEVAQIVSAFFAACAATAAWTAVRHSGAQSRTAREAFEAQTQPLLLDVPRGQSEGEDVGEIVVGTAGGPEMLAFASVPVRNVGTGSARIQKVVFGVGDHRVVGAADNPVVPRGEMTNLRLGRAEGDEGFCVAESIGLENEDFAVTVAYAEVGGRPRGALSLSIRNGQHPRVTARDWQDAPQPRRGITRRRPGQSMPP